MRAAVATMLRRTLCFALFPVASFCGFGRSFFYLEREFLVLDFDDVLQSAAAQDAGVGVHGTCVVVVSRASVGELRRSRPTLPRAIRGHDASGLPRAECVGGGLECVVVPLVLKDNITKCEIASGDEL